MFELNRSTLLGGKNVASEGEGVLPIAVATVVIEEEGRFSPVVVAAAEELSSGGGRVDVIQGAGVRDTEAGR